MKLQLMGLPKFISKDTTQPIRLTTPSLLLIYLAFRSDWVSRSELAFLFKPDDSEAAALKHLRLLLYRAKQLEWSSQLDIEEKRVRFLIPTDVQAFKQALSQQSWREASNLYTNPLLGTFNSDLSTFNAWLELERFDLEAELSEALRAYALALEEEGQFESAAAVLADLLKLDAFDEEAVQAYLKNLYLAGLKAKAIQAYKDFCALLFKDYEAEPVEATQVLFEQIRTGQLTAEPKAIAVKTLQSANLPEQITRFVGRKKELKDLQEQLRQPACRLLSLIGLGGTGKTRLSLELARLVESNYREGVFFVALAALNSRAALEAGLAQVLGLTLNPKQEAFEQILAFLSNKNMLIIFDNFEHLLTEAKLVSDLLTHTEALQVIVTSRERLNLNEEWLYDLEGLSYPKQLKASHDLLTYDAVTLFINSSKRVNPKLELNAEDLLVVAGITQHVQGLPLALELAASWAKAMPVSSIYEELKKDARLLRSEHEGLAERHRNLNSILEKTWLGLSVKKQESLAKFSVFEGGATLEAAEEVTGTHFSLLLSLVNESLLQRVPPDRFDMHAVLKQFVRNHVTEPNQLEASYKQYFADYLYAHTNRSDAEKLIKRNQLQQDLDNLRKAWQLMLSPLDSVSLLKAVDSMYDLYFNKSYFYEGQVLFQNALEILDKQPEKPAALLGKLLQCSGTFHMHLGQVELAKEHYTRALAYLASVNDLEEQAYVYKNLGLVAKQQADLVKAVEAFKHSLQLFRQLKDDTGIAHALNALGITLKNQENYAEAQRCLNESLELFEKLELEDDVAIVNHNLGSIALMQADYALARKHYLSSLAVFERYEYRHGVAASNTNLGNLELKLGNFSQAILYLNKSIELKKEVGDLVSLPEPLRQLGLSYRGLKDYELAIDHLLEAIDIAIGPQPESFIVQLLFDLADTLLEAGFTQEALTLLDSCEARSNDSFIKHYISPLKEKLSPTKPSKALKTPLDSYLERIQASY